MSRNPSGQPRNAPIQTRFFYGWVILAVSALAVFISGPGQTFNFSVFIDPIISETGWTRTQIAGLYAAGSLTASIIIIGIGHLLDRYGARVVLTVIVTLFGSAALWMSHIESRFEIYLGFAAMRTLGQGAMTMIPTTLVATWFVQTRGRATAIASLGGALSAAIFPILSHFLISQYGWRNAWIVLAFVIWGTMLLPSFLLVRRSPESIGLNADGICFDELTAPSITSYHSDTDFTLSSAMHTHSFWLLLIAGSSFSLISTALTFHNVALLTEKGLTPAVAASALSVMAIFVSLGTVVSGYLNDHFPNRLVLAGSQLILISAMLITFIISSPGMAFTYAALLGISNGFGATTTTVIWPNYFGRAHLGKIRGMAMMSTMAFAALGPLPFSALHDITESFNFAVAVFLALPSFCAILALLASKPNLHHTNSFQRTH
jgi:MFS family permease